MNTVRGPKDYALLEELASGSDGNTYVARRAGAYSTLVALKLVPEQLTTDQHLLARLSEEVQIARSLRHPNLIQVLELVLDDQSAAFVLDLNHGRTLGQLIDGAEAVGRRMTLAMVAVLVADIGRALHYLHEFELPGHALGLVHGNVSPRNINVGFDGSVQLIETGLARAAGRKRSLLGGLGYMSPEQVAGEDADRRSDVYGLGIIMYELLCGRRVFAGLPSMTELREALAHHPHAVHSPTSWTGPTLTDICARALAPSADARYPTCQAMVDDLERWIAEHVPTPTAVGLDLFAQEIAGVDEPDVMNVATMPPGSMLGRGRRMTTDGTPTDEPARSGNATERPTGASPASSSLPPEPSPIDTNVDHKAPSASPESPDTGLAESVDAAPISDVWSVMDFPDSSGADAGWMADMAADGGAFGDASELAALSNDLPAAAPEPAAPEPATEAAPPAAETAPKPVSEATPAPPDDAPAEARAEGALSASSDFDMFDSFGAPGEGVEGLAARPAPAEAPAGAPAEAPPADAPEQEQEEEEEERGKLQSALASDFSIPPLDMLVAADLPAPPPAEPEFASIPLAPAPGAGPLPELKSTGPDVLTMDLDVVPVARPSLLTPMAWAGIIGGGVFVVLIIVLVVVLTGGDDKKTTPANGGAIAALQPDASATPEVDAGAAAKEEKENNDETWVKADDEDFPETDKDKAADKAVDKKGADSRRRRVARGAARRRGGAAGGGPGEAPAPPKDNGNWQARGQSLLTISCSAPAEITVDGRVVGRTPRSVPVPPGSHKVSMKRISDGRKYARTVNTSKGQQSPVACVFR